jgi:hypothetical protein
MISFASSLESSARKDGLALMTLEACRQVYRAGVVKRANFATPNPLESQMTRKVLSPLSNIGAVTSKFHTHSKPSRVEKSLTSKSRASLKLP